MSHRQDHQSDSVWQKYPAAILQVIKGMMGEGCMHLLCPFFSHLRKPVTDLNWWFILSSLSTGSSQEWTLMSCFHCPFLYTFCTPLAASQPYIQFSPLLWECMAMGNAAVKAHSFQKALNRPSVHWRVSSKGPISLEHCIFSRNWIHLANILHKALKQMLMKWYHTDSLQKIFREKKS